MIAIRPCREDDSDTVLDIYNRAVREIACKDYSPAQIAAWAPWDRDTSAFAARLRAKPTFIAEIGDHAAGFADLEPDGHIDLFFVHPEHQRRGVGTALLDFLEALARSHGLDRLYAEVSITARPLFDGRGFAIIAPQLVEIRGQTLRNYKMEKLLGETSP